MIKKSFFEYICFRYRHHIAGTKNKRSQTKILFYAKIIPVIVFSIGVL